MGNKQVNCDELIAALNELKKRCSELNGIYSSLNNNKPSAVHGTYVKKLNMSIDSLTKQIGLLEGFGSGNSGSVSKYDLGNISTENRTLFEDRIKTIYNGMRLANELCSYDDAILYIIAYRSESEVFNLLRKVQSIKDYYGSGANRFHFNSDNLDSDEAKQKKLQKPFPKNKTIDKIIIITKPDNVGIVRLFNSCIDGVISLKYRDLQAIAEYSCSACSLHQNIICQSDTMRVMGHRRETDEGQWVRTLMFGGVTDIERELCIPHDDFVTRSLPEVGEETKVIAEAFIKKKKIAVEDTYVLCPVSQESGMPNNGVWEKVSKKLYSDGKEVYTYISKNESPIKGTRALETDIDVLAYLCLKGCRVMGVHGSVTDTLSMVSPKNLIVLFVVKSDADRQYAASRKVINEINKMHDGATYIRIENADDEEIFNSLIKNKII